MPSYQYTTAVRIQSRISANGYNLRLDDVTTPNNVTLINDVMDWAADDCEVYVWNKYTLSLLSTNSWFIQQVTNVAVAYLCMRRMNSVPQSPYEAYERSIALLERVNTGNLKITGVPQSKGTAPAISNLRVSQRPFNRVVVEVVASKTAGAKTMDGFQPNRDDTEWFDPAAGFGWGI